MFHTSRAMYDADLQGSLGTVLCANRHIPACVWELHEVYTSRELMTRQYSGSTTAAYLVSEGRSQWMMWGRHVS